MSFFAAHRLDAIDRELCLAFKARKLKKAAEIRASVAAGAELRDKHGRQVRPLGPSSIRKLIDTLAAILDDAIEDELIDRNPARGKRMRVRVPKPPRTFLEMDELVALIDAAEEQDRVPAIPVPIEGGDSTRDRVARLAASGMRPSAIAAELGIAKATVSFHLGNLGAATRRPTRAVARSSRCSAAAACASASCATCGSATSASTTPTAPASASPTPRPRPASARSR